VNCNSRSSHRINMQDSASQTLQELSHGLSSTTDPPLSHQAVAQENLLRLLRPGSAQTTATSPDNFPTTNFSNALINDTAPARMPNVETRNTASAPPGTNSENRTASASSSEDGFEGCLTHLNLDPPIDRVGRFEVLNDVSRRELKVFRKSPCAHRARNSSHESDTEDPEG